MTCSACNGTGYRVGRGDFGRLDAGVTVSACEECQPGLWIEDWGFCTVNGKRSLLGRLAKGIAEVYDEGNVDFAAYMQGVIDALTETFGDEAVDELLTHLPAPARRDWIAAMREGY